MCCVGSAVEELAGQWAGKGGAAKMDGGGIEEVVKDKAD